MRSIRASRWRCAIGETGADDNDKLLALALEPPSSANTKLM